MRKKIKREDIIHTGLHLLSLHGYHATGIKDITEAVGIPKGSFYNHFASKEAFALEVLALYESQAEALLLRFLGDSAHPPLHRIRHFFAERARAYAQEHRYRFGCLAGNYASELGDVHGAFARASHTTLEKIRSLIEGGLAEAVSQGDLPAGIDPGMVAEFITNSWQGALVKMKSSRSTLPLDNFLTCIFDLWLPGLRATS